MKTKDLTQLLSAEIFSPLDVHFARLLTRLNGESIPNWPLLEHW